MPARVTPGRRMRKREMTSQINTALGAFVAVTGLQAVNDPVDALATISGVALMVWLTLRKSKECDKLRGENHQLREEHAKMRGELQKLSRELGKRCSDCRLAMAANEAYIEEHNEKERA